LKKSFTGVLWRLIESTQCPRSNRADTSAFQGFVLHAIDTVGLVHALLLRIQALLLPIKMLVLGGH
jgi:hypothetical protein